MNVGTTSLSNVLLRDRTSLDGEWNVIVDPYEMGYIGSSAGATSAASTAISHLATPLTASSTTSIDRRR
ncbi:MAG: hypothetical protein AAFP84_12645 [Actinomycetota bacterium]